MKKFIVFTIAALSLTIIFGCSSNSPQVADSIPSDGWEMPAMTDKPICSHDALDAFNAVKSSDSDFRYSAVAELGTQVVAGENFAILCEDPDTATDPTEDWNVAIVYSGVDGSKELVKVVDFDFIAYTNPDFDGNAVPDNELAGGWNISVPNDTATLPEDAKNAFDKITSISGAEYLPIAYLGSHHDSSTYYAILCVDVPNDESDSSLCVITICDNGSNGAISNIEQVDLSSLCA